MSSHWESCWQVHPVCAQLEIRRLQAVERKLQRETEELVGDYEMAAVTLKGMVRHCGLPVESVCADWDTPIGSLGLTLAENYLRLKNASNVSGGSWPCQDVPIYFDAFAEEETAHDHIEAPVVSRGPTWAYRAEEPPSVTP